MRDSPRIVFIFNHAPLRRTLIAGVSTVLDSAEHAAELTKRGIDPAPYRPDILHSCLMAVLDSPLALAGRAEVYVRTPEECFCVHPSTVLPRSQSRFRAMLGYLIGQDNGKIKARGGGPILLKKVKNDLNQILPPNTRTIALHLRNADELPLTNAEIAAYTADRARRRARATTIDEVTLVDREPALPSQRRAADLPPVAPAVLLEGAAKAVTAVVVSVGADRLLTISAEEPVTEHVRLPRETAASLATMMVVGAAEQMWNIK